MFSDDEESSELEEDMMLEQENEDDDEDDKMAKSHDLAKSKRIQERMKNIEME